MSDKAIAVVVKGGLVIWSVIVLGLGIVIGEALLPTDDDLPEAHDRVNPAKPHEMATPEYAPEDSIDTGQFVEFEPVAK